MCPLYEGSCLETIEMPRCIKRFQLMPNLRLQDYSGSDSKSSEVLVYNNIGNYVL